MSKKTKRSRVARSGLAEGYVHGFSAVEQNRLYRQARFLESSIYDTVDFSAQHSLLEVGCGVGAQTEILLERFPHLRISGVDSAPEQIARAKRRLTRAVKRGQASFEVADALKLRFDDNAFDSAFLCWFLEHVQEPVGILKEVRRVLKSGAVIHCCEVQNATFFVHPYSPATLKYWYEFNDWQWSLKGDPFAGAKLANYLLAAGFQEVETRVKTHHHDNRAPKQRAEFMEYWTSLLLSGAPALIESKKVTRDLVKQMTRELHTLKDHPDSVFFYSHVQASARVR